MAVTRRDYTLVSFAMIAFAVLQWRYVVGGLAYYHDSLAALANLFLFYDRIFSGDWWLWSSASNAGHPLWPLTELMPASDPIAFAIWGLSRMIRVSALTAYQLTCIAWLFIFSVGGYLCAHRFSRTPFGPAMALLLLLIGPIALSLPAQSYGFLVPFRYLPLVLYFYLEIFSGKERARSIRLGCAAALAWAGYQSGFLGVALVGFALSHALVKLAQGQGATVFRAYRHHVPMAIFIALIGLLPTLVWLAETSELAAIPRIYEEHVNYTVNDEDAGRSFLAPFAELAGLPLSFDTWHGTLYVGLGPIFFFLYAAGRIFLDLVLSFRAKARGVSAVDSEEVGTAAIWMLFGGFMLLLCLGKFGIRATVEDQGAFLGLRNWGFMMTPVLLAIALVAGYGFDRFARDRGKDNSYAMVFSATLAGIAFFVVLQIDHASVFRPWGAAFAALCLAGLAFRLRAVIPFPAPMWDGCVWLFVLIALYSMSFAIVHASHYEAALSEKQNEEQFFNSHALYRAFKANMPSFDGSEHKYVQRRTWALNPDWKFPFQLEAAEINAESTAFVYPQVPLAYNLPLPHVKITHQFRLKRYHDVVTRYENSASSAALRIVLGVDSDILRMVNGVVPARNVEDALDLVGLLGRGDLLRDVAVVEGDVGEGSLIFRYQPSELPSRGASDLEYTVNVLRFSPERLTIRVDAKQTGLLIYADNFAKNWGVSIDGVDHQLLIANVTNKAVVVPAGSHVIEFTYRPMAYLVAFLLRAALYLAVACTLVWAGFRGLRRMGGQWLRSAKMQATTP